jgi:hypothetical protein
MDCHGSGMAGHDRVFTQGSTCIYTDDWGIGIMPRRGTSGNQAQVVQLIEYTADGSDISAIVGKALRAQGIGGRPPGAKSSKELRKEWKVGRSAMQRIIKQLLAEGAIEMCKITEYDEQGQAKPNVVYVAVGIREG